MNSSPVYAIRLKCNDDDRKWYRSGEGAQPEAIGWGQSQFCPLGHKITGIKIQYRGDETTMASIKLLCTSFERNMIDCKYLCFSVLFLAYYYVFPRNFMSYV